MAGSSPVDLAVAVAEAGGMGAMGALLSSPETISDIQRMQLWAGQSAAFARRESAGDFVRRVWAQAQKFLPTS